MTDVGPDSTDSHAPPTPLALLTGVSRTFGTVQALRGLDLTIPTGIVGVLGPNGAGKSTLFRLLLGLDSADQGDVRVFDKRMPDEALEVRARVGYMPEDDSLFPNLHGLDQVVLAAQLCGLDRSDAVARAHQALDLVGLTDARYRMASGFSLGMRQRLRLAMAVVHGPRLLLLDEPTAGLDPEGRAQMLNLIKEIASHGVSVLLSTHVLADVEAVCEQVILLSRGQLGFAGSMQRFRSGTSADAWRVTLDGDQHQQDDLLNALRKSGLAATQVDGDLVLQIDREQLEAFWRLAAQTGVGVRHFAPFEEAMGAAFVRHLRLDDPLRRQGQVALDSPQPADRADSRSEAP